MEILIYVALLLSGGIVGWFLGRSKMAQTKPIVVEQLAPAPKAKRAYVRKAKLGETNSTNATVNVSKVGAGLPNGRYVETDKAADAQHSAEY